MDEMRPATKADWWLLLLVIPVGLACLTYVAVTAPGGELAVAMMAFLTLCWICNLPRLFVARKPRNPFLYEGQGAEVARRRYDPNPPNRIDTNGQLNAFMASLSAQELWDLAIWERNNPPPSSGRDWLRNPEDRYE